MEEKIVNKKMREVIDFFNIENEELQEVLGENVIDEDYDFSKLSVPKVILLSKKYSISIKVLEEIFVNSSNNIDELKSMLNLFKPTGILRRVDELGRVVIAKEYRDFLSILEKDIVEVSLNEKEEIVIRSQKRCNCCGRKQDLIKNNETYICKSCIKKYNKQLNE